MTEYLEREYILNAIRKNSDLYVDQQGLYLSCELIAAMPASDVQPVRYGKWNIKDNHFHSNIIMNYAECSCCGHTCSTTESTHNNYCPNCGARMIKDGEHND